MMRRAKPLRKQVAQISLILFGACLLAFAYYHINFQNHLSEGGFVGLALLAKYGFNFPPAVTMLVLDIPLFIMAWMLKGRQFIWNTILASLAFSGFYELFERFSPVVIDLGNHMLAASILSGLLTGLATGIILRFGAATGGDDIMSVLLSKYTGLSIGTIFLLLDCMVLALSFLYLPMGEVFYTVIAVVIASRVITWTVGKSAMAEEEETVAGHGHVEGARSSL
ncbi:YitT family protein [Brevibacillus ruminantium]|uniref:YitT family protein n=1 Tax=Brevibacillus ruminantium TaxID=2950604 RepID=A0ABY4WJZ7_9BACL|nr:YitT family protein [Brevibacillus ruminantium]USG67483.1 YitT family protein [Brevibacillus ruminantium]